MPYYKVVITGPFSAGKTSFIRTVNEIRGVSTEVATDIGRHVKEQTTVAMDYGRVTLPSGVTLHLVGTPGQSRFSFLWEMLTIESSGIVLLIDSHEPQSIVDAGRMIDFFNLRAPGVPLVVVANKQDLDGALPPEELGRKLNLARTLDTGRPVSILPPLGCVAEDPASVIAVLEAIVPYLLVTAPDKAEARPVL